MHHLGTKLGCDTGLPPSQRKAAPDVIEKDRDVQRHTGRG
jgi:hypothetical protein